MQVFELASCLFLQAQSSSPTSAPAAICSISTHFFRATPLFSLNVWLFSNHDPKSAIFALSTTPSQISETARTAGRCDRRGARTTPAALSCFAACGFSLCRNPPGGILLLRLAFPQRSRAAAQRPVFCCWMGTRSAGLRKLHKPSTRARQRGNCVLAVRLTCVLNKIGIFSSRRVLVQLLHLPVIVLLERRLNRSDCE